MPRYAQCWTLQRASGPELEKLIRAAHALVDLGFHSLAVAELVALHLQHEECTVAQTVRQRALHPKRVGRSILLPKHVSHTTPCIKHG